MPKIMGQRDELYIWLNNFANKDYWRFGGKETHLMFLKETCAKKYQLLGEACGLKMSCWSMKMALQVIQNTIET